MDTMMTEKDFARAARTYGSALSRWPDTMRGAAENFARQHPHIAQPILQSEQDIDATLARAPVQTISAALDARIIDSFNAAQAPDKLRQWFSFLMVFPQTSLPAMGAALALLLVCGFAGGYTGYSYALNQRGSVEVLNQAFGSEELSFYTEDSTT